MIFNSISFLPALLEGLVLKSAMYYGVFRWQKIPATLLACIVIAGSELCVSLIPLFFIPRLLVVIALATYLCARNADIPYFPHALAIVAGVELVGNAIVAYIISPVIHLL